MGGRRKIYIIINPVSGYGHKGMISGKINALIDTARFDHQIVFTNYKGHAREISAKAAAENAFAVIAVGGDGSINDIACGIVNTPTALGIIPRGSGNGLARSLKVPFNLDSAISAINQMNIQTIDTGSVNGHVFTNMAGVGFDGLVSEKFAGLKFRGFLGYMRIVASEYFAYKPQKYKLKMDGHLTTQRALFVSFANSNQFGYNTVIAPDAALDDGLLDVCVFQKPLLIDIPKLARQMYLGRIDESKYMQTYKCTRVALNRREDTPIHVDGEPLKVGKALNVKINPASLRVIVPSGIK